jgi:hypothetical protein
MKIDYIIMGHHSRQTYSDQLSDQISEATGICSTVIDTQTQGAWTIASQAWQLVSPQSNYGLVIQDDAILCDDFTTKAESFLKEHNGQICSFYFGDDPDKQHWIKPDYFDAPLFHAVALAIPTKLIPDMIQYCDTRNEIEGDDMKIKRWLISQNRTCRYSNPSLVQHRDIPSIINPQKPKRQSAIFQP